MHNVSLVFLKRKLKYWHMQWEKAFKMHQYTLADSMVDYMDHLQNQIDELEKRRAA